MLVDGVPWQDLSPNAPVLIEHADDRSLRVVLRLPAECSVSDVELVERQGALHVKFPMAGRRSVVIQADTFDWGCARATASLKRHRMVVSCPRRFAI